MFRKNVSGQFIHFQGVDAATGGIKSGVSWTVRRCIDGTFAAATGTVTEDGTTGWYKFALSQADTNGNNIGFNFTGTGAIPQTVNITTDVDSIVEGVVGSDSTATSIVTSSLAPAASVTDQFKGRIVIFDRATTTAALRGQATDITGSTAGGVLTVSALTTSPANGDIFRIY